MIQHALHKIIDHGHLSRDEAFATMARIMEGQATPSQIGALLVGLRMKGETPEEIAGFAACMREKAAKVGARDTAHLVDIVGTGGDGKQTFNISTVAALVAAGAGATVAKHGNRAVSSKCGSADVLRELGVHIELDAAQMSRCLDEVGIAFLFAPMLHPAMKFAVAPRREIGVRTVFNILGPITNPAGVQRQLIGVYDRALLPLLAEVLRQLGAAHVLIVHHEQGYDEIIPHGRCHVAEVRDGRVREFRLSMQDFGLRESHEKIPGGDVARNAAIALSVLRGEQGIARTVAIANTAAALVVAGIAADYHDGVARAAHSIDSGAASQKLAALCELTQAMAKEDQAKN